jgi:hypothetical protein
MGTIRAESTLIVGHLPIICWRNIVTATNVDAESDADFPASNVANPSTALKWKHDTTDSPVSAIEYFRVDISQSNPINYVAIAGHNFGSQGIAVGLELASFGSPVGGAESAFEPLIPADDGPIVFLFTEREVEEIRIVFIPTSTAAEMAVVRAGIYTQLEEGIQAAHTPLPLARVSEVMNGKSENGAFLGRVVISEGLVSTATITNIEEDFVIDEVIDFLAFASEFPFFWLWSPTTYPDQTAFAWLENDPQPSRDIDGYWAVDLAMRGLGA